ncbi:MAG: hypothetical protein JWN32_2502 [Solirubrobacterales bacterium]|nr:hypothetical protein [Solirubrobacterales bacterium]
MGGQAVGLSPDEFVARRAVLQSLAGARRVSPGVVLPGDVPPRDRAELVDHARTWQAAGAGHLALHFGAADEADERTTGFAARWSRAGRWRRRLVASNNDAPPDIYVTRH